MLTRAGARRQEVERVECARAAFDALPNDLLVSIFATFLAEPEFVQSPEERARRRSSNLCWVRETFPLVCRRWRDLYYSRDASPLHETLEVEFLWEMPEAVPRRFVRAESVIAWARRRHAGDVRALRLVDSSCPGPGDFSSENLATLVEVLGPHLTEIEAFGSLGSLERPFWDSLRKVVAPAGQLRKLDVAAIGVHLAEGEALVDGSDDVDVSFLGKITSLETLRLHSYGVLRLGLRAFPASVLSCTRLRRLELLWHKAITSLPPAISSLQALESLVMRGCSLRALPEELGALTRLTRLDLGRGAANRELGEAAEDVAFPQAAVRGLKQSLRSLGLSGCRLRSIPSFIGELEALEDLDLFGNEQLRDAGFPETFPAALPALTRLNLSYCSLASVPPAVLSSMPRLRILDLSYNRLTSLPEDLGQRLPELREIDLRWNRFERVPLRALAGATSLEKINLNANGRLQVEEPLDALVDSLPRLREVNVFRMHGPQWTPASREHLERFAARLRERDPTAVVEF